MTTPRFFVTFICIPLDYSKKYTHPPPRVLAYKFNDNNAYMNGVIDASIITSIATKYSSQKSSQ
jgi:hypothetical protein